MEETLLIKLKKSTFKTPEKRQKGVTITSVKTMSLKASYPETPVTSN